MKRWWLSLPCLIIAACDSQSGASAGPMVGPPAEIGTGGASATLPVADDASPPAPTTPLARSMTSGAGAAATAPMATLQPMAAGWPSDCDRHVSLQAHAVAAPGDTTKFQVPAGQEFTATFTFKAPWGDSPVQFLASRGHLDQRSVVHHWTLFAVDDSSLTDGMVEGGAGLPAPAKSPNQMYVVGGTIGSATDLTMPEGIGLRFPSGSDVFFRLEVHYVNPSDDTQEDGSGLEFCVTSQARAIEAAVHWLGTYLLDVPPHAKTDVTSNCVPSGATKPVHLMTAAPHMHRTGSAAKLVLTRTTGESVTLIDHPYDYDDQRAYKLPEDGASADVIMNPGDTLITTCTYQNNTENPITWGEYSYDEMCFTLVWAWPVGQISNGSLLGGVVGALPDVTCLEP